MEAVHVKVFTDLSIIANRLQDILKEHNIPSFIKDHIESARLAGFGSFQNSVDLYILSTDVERATSIISDFKKEISK